MYYLNDADALNEIRNQLVYPADIYLPRWVMKKTLQISEHEYRKLMKLETFTCFEHLGIIWFYTREIYHWAYKFKSEVTQLIIPFPSHDDRLLLRSA